MTRKVFSGKLLFVLLLVAAIAATIWYFNRPRPIEVKVTEVSKGMVESTVSNTRAGTIKACRRAKLSPSIGGQIANLLVAEGDEVKQGALLLELWNADLQAELVFSKSQAEATSAQARAACLRAAEASRRAERLDSLNTRSAVSVDRVDEAKTAARALKAECEASRAGQRVSDSRIEVSKANLERTRLYAPFNGVVAEINGEVSEYVTPSPIGVATPPAVDLIDNTCFYITAPIDEVDAARIKIGMPAKITLDAFDEQEFSGRVKRIADYVVDLEKQARTVDVDVEFSNKKDLELLLAGYSADVEVIIETREEVIKIPTEAILEGNQVYLLNTLTGLVEKKEIETGLSNWNFSEILKGINSGDNLITTVDREGLEDGAEAVIEDAAK